MKYTDVQGNIMNTTAHTLMEELPAPNAWMKNTKMATHPQWLCLEPELLEKQLALIVVAYEQQEDVDKILCHSSVFVIGCVCYISFYVKISPVCYCERLVMPKFSSKTWF
jgi:hypothetical protein